MNLGKKLAIAVLGLNLLTGCASLGNPHITKDGLIVSEEYDTNKDGKPDLKYTYRISSFNRNRNAFTFGRELIEVQRDFDYDGNFETVWKKDPREVNLY